MQPLVPLRVLLVVFRRIELSSYLMGFIQAVLVKKMTTATDLTVSADAISIQPWLVTKYCIRRLRRGIEQMRRRKQPWLD